MRCQLLFFFIPFILLGCTVTGPAPLTPVNLSAAATINTQLALAYLSDDDSEHAKQKLLLAQQQAPKDPVVYNAWGYFYERTHDFVNARRYYQHALQLEPKLGTTNNNYGAFLC